MLLGNLDQDAGLLRRGRSLDRRHADTLVAIVEDGVVLAHEDVSKNPHLAKLRRELDRHESEQALALDLPDSKNTSASSGHNP